MHINVGASMNRLEAFEQFRTRMNEKILKVIWTPNASSGWTATSTRTANWTGAPRR
jgi:hypothetical protein